MDGNSLLYVTICQKGGHRVCGSRDKMFLICHATSCDQEFERSNDFMGGTSSGKSLHRRIWRSQTFWQCRINVLHFSRDQSIKNALLKILSKEIMTAKQLNQTTAIYRGIESFPVPSNSLTIFTAHYFVNRGWKVNVYKTFRSCSGRRLNVLCIFNLGSVPRE